MNSSNNEDDLRGIARELAQYDDSAARMHLAAGRPIYYHDQVNGELVREWPDGRIELVDVDEDGHISCYRG